jgi:hypothetical protein
MYSLYSILLSQGSKAPLRTRLVVDKAGEDNDLIKLSLSNMSLIYLCLIGTIEPSLLFISQTSIDMFSLAGDEELHLRLLIDLRFDRPLDFDPYWNWIMCCVCPISLVSRALWTKTGFIVSVVPSTATCV